MARSRKISTDISIEIKLNRVSDFAALLYSWMIPHAKDDCRLPKRDPEELRLLIMPGRNKSAEDVQDAIDELTAARLIGVDEDGNYYFPDEVFYRYQSYVGTKNRRPTPKLNKINGARNSEKQRESAEISEEVRECAENSASPSLSLSPSPSIGLLPQPSSRARKSNSNAEDDLGLGQRHPAALVGFPLWSKLETFWRAEGKRIGIVQLEMHWQRLIDYQKRGHDPVAVVELALRNGWKDLYEPETPAEPPGQVYDFEAIRAHAAEAAAKARSQ